MKLKYYWMTLAVVTLIALGVTLITTEAQNADEPAAEAVAPTVPVSAAPAPAEPVGPAPGPAKDAKAPPPPAGIQNLRVTLNVEDTLVTQILNAFSRQTGRSIVIGPGITERTTVRLNDVSWTEAMEAVLKPFGYVHYEQGEATVVTTVTPSSTRVFEIKHLDVSDVEETIRSMLSPAGKLGKVTTRSQSWNNASQSSSSVAGGETMGKRQRVQEEKELTKSKLLVVTDNQRVLDQIAMFLSEVDVAPRQILIEARFMEVNPRVLRDLGLEFGTRGGYARNGNAYRYGLESVNGEVVPGNFSPVSAPSLNATTPFNAGMNLAFQKLTDIQYGILLHALQEDSSADTLSAPRILTLNNQEASIIVGTKYPIINSDATSSGGGAATITTSLRGYEDIGIQLNVLPQLCDGNLISMIVRPSVRELVGTRSGKTVSGEVTALTDYPVISTRETETQVVLQDGQTIVIGGLLKDRVSKVTFKTPFLGDIPILGWLFRRETLQTEKVDLLIFLTATSVPAEGAPLILTNVNSLARGPALVSPSSAVASDASVVTPSDLRSVAPDVLAVEAAPAVNQPLTSEPEAAPVVEAVAREEAASLTVVEVPAEAPSTPVVVEQALPTPAPEPAAEPAPASAPEVFSPENMPQPGLHEMPGTETAPNAETET